MKIMSAVCTESLRSYDIPFSPLRWADPRPSDHLTTPDLRLIPCAIDEAARLHSQLTFASIPITSDVKDGFRDITFGELGNAINRAATWLEASRCHAEPLAYLAPSDLRHVVLAVAAVKVGCNVCL